MKQAHAELWQAMLKRSFDPSRWHIDKDCPDEMGQSRKEGTIMWVYRRTEPNVWTVGFFGPDTSWNAESDHATRDDAAARVHYLNGGGGSDEEDAVSASARVGYASR